MMNNREIEENRISKSTGTIDTARKSLADALRLSFNILKFVMAVVLILFLTSGIFVVHQHESGVVYRFGKIAGKPGEKVLDPGLHWAWPFPVDEHVILPTARVRTMEISFMPSGREVTARGRRKIPEKLQPGIDRYCLTGDANIINSKWLIRYRIDDPIAYVTGALLPEKILKVFSLAAIIRETSRFGVDEALRTRVDELRRSVSKTIKKQLLRADIGLALEGVDLKEIIPPEQVMGAFNSVVMAEQERSQKINEARAYENKIVNEAGGESARIVSQANTSRTRVVEQTRADSEYIKSLLKQYPGKPEMLIVYLRQLYHEKIGETLAEVEERFILAKGKPGQDREIMYVIGPRKK